MYRLLKGSTGSEFSLKLVLFHMGPVDGADALFSWSLLPTEQFIIFFSKMNILFPKKKKRNLFPLAFFSFAVSFTHPPPIRLLYFFIYSVSFICPRHHFPLFPFLSLASSLPHAVFPSFFCSFPLINHFHHFPFALFPRFLSSIPFFFSFFIFGIVLIFCYICYILLTLISFILFYNARRAVRSWQQGELHRRPCWWYGRLHRILGQLPQTVELRRPCRE